MKEQVEFIKNLKYYREKMCFSQADLAGFCECSSATIAAIETGRIKPSFDMMCKIARSMKISPADLFLRNAGRAKRQTRMFLRQKFAEIMDGV